MSDFRPVIVIVDIYPELNFLQFGPGGLLLLLLLRNVVTEFPEIDDLADGRICRRRHFHQIKSETLRFADGVGQFHDTELLA